MSQKWEEKQQSEKQSQSEQYEISIKYRDRIHEVESQRDKILEKLEAQKMVHNEQYTQEIKELNEIPKKVKKIIHFLEAQQSKLDFDITKIKGYKRYQEQFPIEILERYNDECLTLGLFLGKCDRKVNNYVLSIAGESLLGGENFRDILDLKHHYGTAIDTFQLGNNIEFDVKFFPTKQSAINYAEKHKLEGILKEFMTKYKIIKAEYDKVIETYDLEDFRKIIIDDIRYYWTHSVGYPDTFLKELGIKNFKWEKMSNAEKQKVIDWKRKGSKKRILIKGENN